MMYFKFENGFESFKLLFGKRMTNNGNSVRQNGILLSFLKNEFKRKNFSALGINSMTNLYLYIMNQLYERTGEVNVCLKWGSNTLFAYSPDYHTDKRRGFCEDYDSRSVRYVRNDNEKVYKMKAGKFMRHLLMNNPRTSGFCEQAINYVCETFASEWTAYVESENPDRFKLVVDEDFETIYRGSYLDGDFGSCMVDRDYDSFYRDAVKASAASLWKGELIVARCVIFNEVLNEKTGEVLRLAERQYASNGSDDLKRILVNRLIAENYIDGYKKVGAGCHDNHAFVLNDGSSIEDANLSIECNLELGDTVSYQDSFVYYNISENRAYNDSSCHYDYELNTTEGEIEAEWDSYHECYCTETTTVYVWNSRCERYFEETCDVNRLEDFRFIEEYDNFYDETEYCSYYGKYYPMDECSYCEEMDDYLPNDEYDKILEDWKDDNWEWDEINEEYVPETIKVYVWSESRQVYNEVWTSESYAENNFKSYEGEYYNEVSESGVPYDVELCEAV